MSVLPLLFKLPALQFSSGRKFRNLKGQFFQIRGAEPFSLFSICMADDGEKVCSTVMLTCEKTMTKSMQ